MTILLALFGAVVGVLAIIQKLDSEQIGNIVGYELPLSRIVAQFDVDTDRKTVNLNTSGYAAAWECGVAIHDRALIE
jgi:hypothetical protein